MLNFEKEGFEKIDELGEEGGAHLFSVKKDSKSYLLYTFEDPLHFARAKFAFTTLSSHLFVVPPIQECGANWFSLEIKGVNAKVFFAEQGRPREKIKYAKEVGCFLRKLHNCPAPTRFGDPISEKRDRSWLTFNGYVAAKLELYSEHLREQFFSDEAIGKIKNAIADLRVQLATFHPRTPPTWNHRRPSAEHIWLNSETLEIEAITGFEYSVFLPPELDIAYFLYIDDVIHDEASILAFYKGYGSARTMDVQRRERFYKRLSALDAIMHDSGPTHLCREELFNIISLTP